MAYLKPQNPIQLKSDYIYPLTTSDQVIMDDNSRLSASKVLTPDTTLTIVGGAAEAKTVGDKITTINNNISSINTSVSTLNTNKLDKTATAANSTLLGGLSSDFYKNFSLKNVSGLLLNGESTTLQGIGNLTLIGYNNGLVEIQFFIKITTADTDNTTSFTWGINRDYFNSTTLGSITPTANVGYWILHRNSALNDAMGYGSNFGVNGQFWTFQRNYTGTPATYGGYSPSIFMTNDIITGTCFGTYSV